MEGGLKCVILVMRRSSFAKLTSGGTPPPPPQARNLSLSAPLGVQSRYVVQRNENGYAFRHPSTMVVQTYTALSTTAAWCVVRFGIPT